MKYRPNSMESTFDQPFHFSVEDCEDTIVINQLVQKLDLLPQSNKATKRPTKKRKNAGEEKQREERKAKKKKKKKKKTQ